MARFGSVFLLILVIGCRSLPEQKPADTSDIELQRLEKMLDAATSQTDMNLASYDIAMFWDARLDKVEGRLGEKLAKPDRKRFTKAEAHWRIYRLAEARFQRGLYDGGSIQPLIASESYSDITRHRVEELNAEVREIEQR